MRASGGRSAPSRRPLDAYETRAPMGALGLHGWGQRLSQNPPRTSGGGGPARCCVLGRRNSLRLLPPPCVLPSLGPALASRTRGVLRQPLSPEVLGEPARVVVL